ncbi:heme anaerobic degradation radical SAM methyltransferase ChuW/HutW [Acetonema longum]|uniref:Coproporphyrinogen III oxidase n=1 Tax=Acetonema longum DSM 6540 TaxID=1009370 RepID=F7NHH7_9FIRM|nr:heme anaerobic degradation radical SAM methyltransferase ChuW/HutW [Acetonema longum]EGO64524.1 coproporphyrinogen III oxidase [Acetonema longum DSM 6540]
MKAANASGRSLKDVLAALEPELSEMVIGRPTDSPLQESFDAKRVMHSGVGGFPLPRGEWQSHWQAALTNPGTGAGRSAYIHIPFCQRKCSYCGFFQNFCQEELETAYIDRLIAELKMSADKPYQSSNPMNAIFLGGGTPSALSPANISRLLKAIHDYLPLTNDCEVTLEGRVHDLIPAKMEAWFADGVNRVSLGVQSFNTKVRQAAGRIDSREVVMERLRALAAYNQVAVIVDLIYGLPYQTPEVWREDLNALKALPLDGWDLYQLNLWENSDMKKAIDAGRIPPAATTQEQAGMFGAARNRLDGWPVNQISVCHWGKTGRERNLYNHMSQKGCVMLPFGAGAGGRLDDALIMLERDIKQYMGRMDRDEKPIMMMLSLHPLTDIHDAVKHQIKQGYLDIAGLAAQFDPRLTELNALLAIWEERGLVARQPEIARLTTAGQFWYVNLTQSVLECINAMLQGEWSWEKQKVAAQG